MNPFSSLYLLLASNIVVVYFLVVGIALVAGIALSLTYKFSKKGKVYTNFMPIALIILPVTMTTIIGLVNLRNMEIEASDYVRIGLVVTVGIALTRFRSDKLSISDMIYLVIASALGVVFGIGYAFYGAIATILILAILIVCHFLKFGENNEGVYLLKYQVGEDLADNATFEDAIKLHCAAFSLQQIRTIEYGQLYEVRYNVTLKKGDTIKALIDEIRLHNANLNVSVSLGDRGQ